MAELAKGPTAHGWEDQRWTLDRIKTVIGRRLHLTYTIQGVRRLMVRNGWSCQVPARRTIERDDDAVAGWVKETWPCAEDSRLVGAVGDRLVTDQHAAVLISWPHRAGTFLAVFTDVFTRADNGLRRS
ncbi:winged helix-turn-helix domain-containing protein [Streptomyces olivaceoviridis]|uniref:helix-turn-helix domain-containing protein n=1 Tax=Streptomyces olivaceoviridis TaxID=1921 RepID=UPI0036BC7725